MPRRRMRKRSFKRNRSRTRSRKTRRTGNSMGANKRDSVIIRSPSFMPDELLTTLKFSEQSSLSFISAVEAELSYIATGLFDCSPASGTQPPGFVELMAIYDEYQVIGCSIELVLNNPSTGQPLAVSLIPNQVSIANMDAQDFRMNAYGKSAFLSPFPGSNNRWKIKHYATTKAILGQSLNTSRDMWGTNAGNPNINWAWILHLTYPNTADEVVFFQISLKFYCRFAQKRLIDPTLAAAQGDDVPP